MDKKDKRLDELLKKALAKISIGDYSLAKIKDFLKKKGASKEEIKIISEKLVRYNYINEDELIANVMYCCDCKHYGFNRLIKMLKDRQVSKDKIDKLVKDDSREHKHAIEQAKRLVKRYKKSNTVNLKRNVYLGLIRHGFDENIASLESSNAFNPPSNELNMIKLDYSKVLSRFSLKVEGKELNNKITKHLLSKGYQMVDIQKIIKEEQYYEMD